MRIKRRNFDAWFTDNERIRFKMTRVSSTGVITFYYSFDLFADSPSWIQFGNPVTGNIR